MTELLEDAWGGKPGPNAAQVGPEARKKLGPLMRHYMKKPHPFTACVRDNTKRFGPERAKRVCAVLKDLATGTTKWRKGPKKKVEEACELLVEAGLHDAHSIDLFSRWLEEQILVADGPEALEEIHADRIEMLAREQRIEEARKSKADGSPGKCASCGKGLPKGIKSKMKRCPHCGKAVTTDSSAIEEAAVKRGMSRLKRLDDGTFAPKGRGKVLTVHEHPRAVRQLPRGTVARGKEGGIRAYAPETHGGDLKAPGGGFSPHLKDVHDSTDVYELPNGAKVKPEALEMLPELEPHEIPDELLNTAIRDAESHSRSADYTASGQRGDSSFREGAKRASDRLSALRAERDKRDLPHTDQEFAHADYSDDTLHADASKIDPHAADSRQSAMEATGKAREAAERKLKDAWEGRNSALPKRGPKAKADEDETPKAKLDPRAKGTFINPHKDGDSRDLSREEVRALDKADLDRRIDANFGANVSAADRKRMKRIADKVSATSPHTIRNLDQLGLLKYAKPTKQRQKMYHGASAELVSAEPGETFRLSRAVSFTGDEKVGGMYGHKVLYDIDVPEGTKTFRPMDVNGMFPSEDEHVLLKNTSIEVTGKSKTKDGKTVVHGRVVNRKLGGKAVSIREAREQEWALRMWLLEAIDEGRVGVELLEALVLQEMRERDPDAHLTMRALREVAASPATPPVPAAGGQQQSFPDPATRTSQLQRRLRHLGHELLDDGQFGPKTDAAVRAFQQQSGLKVDGVVGQVTTQALRSAQAPEQDQGPGQQQRAPADGPKDQGQPVQLDGPLHKGMGVGEESPHDQVRVVQKALGAKEDGAFGPETEKKVRAFQRKMGLASTGIVDARTARALGGKLQEAQTRADTPEYLIAAERRLKKRKRERAHEVEEGKLSTAERKALPKGAFVFPGERRYPIHDEGHARAALSRVAQHGNAAEKARVRAAVKARYPHLVKS